MYSSISYIIIRMSYIQYIGFQRDKNFKGGPAIYCKCCKDFKWEWATSDQFLELEMEKLRHAHDDSWNVSIPMSFSGDLIIHLSLFQQPP